MCRLNYLFFSYSISKDNIKCDSASNAPKCPLNNSVSIVQKLVVKLSNTSTTFSQQVEIRGVSRRFNNIRLEKYPWLRYTKTADGVFCIWCSKDGIIYFVKTCVRDSHSQKWWVLCSFAYLRWPRRDVCNFHIIYIDDIIRNCMCVIFWTWTWYIESSWIKWNKN